MLFKCNFSTCKTYFGEEQRSADRRREDGQIGSIRIRHPVDVDGQTHYVVWPVTTLHKLVVLEDDFGDRRLESTFLYHEPLAAARFSFCRACHQG